MIDWIIFSFLSMSRRTDDEDNNETDHDQCGGDYADQENAASTGGEAAADDPVLYSFQLRSESVVIHLRGKMDQSKEILRLKHCGTIDDK